MSLRDALQAAKNPGHYGMRPGERLEVQLNKALLESVTKLAQHGLVRLHRAWGILLDGRVSLPAITCAAEKSSIHNSPI